MLYILTLGKCQSKSFIRAAQKLGKKARHYPDDLQAAIEQVEVISTMELLTEYQKLEKADSEAKFLMLTRNDAEWEESYKKHAAKIKGCSKEAKVKRIRKKVLGVEHFDPAVWGRKKRNYENKIRKYFVDKQDKFTEINPFNSTDEEKWEVLIKMLDPTLKKPEDDPAFPHVE